MQMTEIYLLLSDPEYDKMKETQMIIYISKNVFSILKNPQMLFREKQCNSLTLNFLFTTMLDSCIVTLSFFYCLLHYLSFFNASTCLRRSFNALESNFKTFDCCTVTASSSSSSSGMGKPCFHKAHF